MRSLLILILGALVGCASSEAGIRSSAPRQTTRVEGLQQTFAGEDAGTLEYTLSSSAFPIEEIVVAPPDKVWPALQVAYRETGLPITVLDPEKQLIGVQSSFRHRLENVPLSTYLDCGRNAVRAPIANSYVVNLTILSVVRPAPNGASKVQMLVEASAKNPVNNDPAVACSSTRTLEKAIIALLLPRIES